MKTDYKKTHLLLALRLPRPQRRREGRAGGRGVGVIGGRAAFTKMAEEEGGKGGPNVRREGVAAVEAVDDVVSRLRERGG